MSRGFRFDAIVLRRLVIGLAIAAFLLAKPGQTIPLAAFGSAAILGTTLLIYLGKAGWPFMAGLVGLGVACQHLPPVRCRSCHRHPWCRLPH